MNTLQRLSLCAAATLLASALLSPVTAADACAPPPPEGEVDIWPTSGEQVTPDVRFFIYYSGTENYREDRYSLTDEAGQPIALEFERMGTRMIASPSAPLLAGSYTFRHETDAEDAERWGVEPVTERTVEVADTLINPDIYLYDFHWTRATYAQTWESPHVGDCRWPRSEAHDILVYASSFAQGELFATFEYLKAEQDASPWTATLIKFAPGDADGEPGAQAPMLATLRSHLSSGSAACIRVTPYHTSGFAYEAVTYCTPDACIDAAQADENGAVPTPTGRDASCRLAPEEPDDDVVDPPQDDEDDVIDPMEEDDDDRDPPMDVNEDLDWREGDDLSDDGCSVAPSGRSSGHTPWPLALLAATLWGVRSRRRESRHGASRDR